MAAIKPSSLQLKGSGPMARQKLDTDRRQQQLTHHQSEEQDDEMGAWAMSLNVNHIAKQRRQRVQFVYPQERPEISSRSQTAMQFHEKWHEHHIETADECLRIGIGKSGSERKQFLQSALKFYNLAEDHWPASLSLLINRCITYELLDQVAKAVPDAERAVQMEPENGKAVYRLAHVSRLVGDAMRADMLYKKCMQLGPTYDVWKEMTQSRLEYLQRSEGFTVAEVDQAHELASSLTEASLIATAVRARHTARDLAHSVSVNRSRSKIRLPLCGNKDFIILDVDQLVKRFNSILTPTNIFGSRVIFLYGCKIRDEIKIRELLAKYGVITGVTVSEDFVRVAFADVSGPVSAISHTSGSLSSGLTENGKRLKVRFADNVMSMEQMLAISMRENQCLGWRTTGCALRRRCTFRHLEADYRVDLHPHMQQATSPFQRVAELQLQKQRQMCGAASQANGVREKESRTMHRVLAPRKA